MAIKGPDLGSNTPSSTPVPPRPNSHRPTRRGSSGKNLVVALAIGLVALVGVVGAVTTIAVIYYLANQSWDSQSPSISEQGPSNSALWGAYAVDDQSEAWGGSWDAPSEQAAVNKAMEMCKSVEGSINCQHFMTFGHGYAALSSSDNTWAVASESDTEEGAKQKSLEECRQKASDPDSCTVVNVLHF